MVKRYVASYAASLYIFSGSRQLQKSQSIIFGCDTVYSASVTSLLSALSI